MPGTRLVCFQLKRATNSISKLSLLSCPARPALSCSASHVLLGLSCLARLVVSCLACPVLSCSSFPDMLGMSCPARPSCLSCSPCMSRSSTDLSKSQGKFLTPTPTILLSSLPSGHAYVSLLIIIPPALLLSIQHTKWPPTSFSERANFE
jgi:hypothetical protein